MSENTTFQQMKLVISVMPRFCVIFTENWFLIILFWWLDVIFKVIFNVGVDVGILYLLVRTRLNEHNSTLNLIFAQCRRRWANKQGRIQGGAQGARAPPLISIVVFFQPIIVYTINPPVSDMLVPAPSTPKYIPLPI